MKLKDDPIVGIDLGTTNSVVALIVDGQPQVVDENGEQTLPSVVGFDQQNKLITGVVARNQLAAYPDRTIASVKRQMGKMDPIRLGEQDFTPPEISAMILRRLRDRASRALQQDVTRAVITVPAFFDENQRQATREAGELAGLKVERIINEPTAATLVYHAGSQDRKQILVYDFGGGTFDVSVVRMEAGVVEVLSSKGDTQLGGDDVDLALLNHIADQFQSEHQIDLRANPSTRYRLLQACEQAKKRLSDQESVQITEEFVADKEGTPLNLIVTVTRSEFEDLIATLVEQTIRTVDEAIRDAKVTIHEIDDLVLVGGSTRIPMVQRRLREEFLCEPSRAVDPDLAVAMGAAVQAAMIAGESVGPVLVDITGHTLGLEVCEGLSFAGPNVVFSPVIHRNSALPASYEQAYSKMHDDQETVEIHVLQGEHREVHRNQSIGNFLLDLEKGGGDRSKIVVRFDLTLDGTLKVTATQPATGISEELTIVNALSQFQDDLRENAAARLSEMFEESEELKAAPTGPTRKQWTVEREEAKVPPAPNASKFPAADAILERVAQLGTSVHDEDAEDIQSLAQQLTQAIQSGDEPAIATLSEELDDILFYVQ